MSELTIAALNEFLVSHGFPDEVIVSGADFIELCSFAGAIVQSNTIWFLGVHWVRSADNKQLDWGDKRIMKNDGSFAVATYK